jgi:hypothetical protein
MNSRLNGAIDRFATSIAFADVFRQPVTDPGAITSVLRLGGDPGDLAYHGLGRVKWSYKYCTGTELLKVLRQKQVENVKTYTQLVDELVTAYVITINRWE